MPSFEDHVDYADPPIRPVLRKLKAGIFRLGPMREKVTAAQRIAYENERDFCEVKIQKNECLSEFSIQACPTPRA